MLNGVEVAGGVAFLDPAAALDQTRFEEHGFGQRGLAASVGAEQDDVLDVLRIENVHGSYRYWWDVRFVPPWRPHASRDL